MGKVYLTGAGPGDIDLLTVKALRVVRNADVIIYDRLANADILKEAKSGCEFIYVGKEDGLHILPQDEINEVIYQNALKHETVVRLKGGDPFVFGRGGEEAKYLKERGISYEIIPGVTSAIAVPAYAGIPVTHRGISVSFKVVTGHEARDKKQLQVDWELMKADETIVFLMGLHNLPKITKNLIEIGKPKETPCAVISRGTTSDQRSVIGTLENINEKVKNAKVQRPALIVVGKVVDLKQDLEWFKVNERL
ncbi:uroporphyrinogen-III C-methyltransferase [Hydrogenimonas thermophila]|uniref:uroporphyrinogen-III C-methyltransferase n=1 Tax=Hydrogenimonas thermophila TaxID=223786 RepID=A0A1I5T0R5_9BACT|nr:uroporphyrinogen-III C-methyltransferase [Hydrogenimonas thermophila]WOE70677.1 uroporphyrinogen-III C-methyltransferase [Hydrogenimonas thermophila]WOE73195.1 uroporphyrinogen-III C-methyltransferase [Hydrogenimonas thermophila]SFP76630.1 uroporphyrin-III C-methyltransferase [Hydrogenimonas thermophila]